MSLSLLAAEHVSNPRNVGPLEGATHEGIAWAPWLLPGDGPYIQLWLAVQSVSPSPPEGERGLGGEGVPSPFAHRPSTLDPSSVIAQATYSANGCPSSIACGSMVAQIVTGRTVEQAMKLEPLDLKLLLGGLAEGKEYCAEMAVKALRAALPTDDVAGPRSTNLPAPST